MAVGDDGFAVRPVPTVQLDAADPASKHSRVGLHTGVGRQLVPHQVGVVGAVDEVVAEGQGHVLVDATEPRVEGTVARGKQQVQKIHEGQVGDNTLAVIGAPSAYNGKTFTFLARDRELKPR